MANQLTQPTPIKVGKAILYTKASAVTVASAATLVSLFTASTDIYNKAKNITITPPTGEIEQVNLIGETTSAKQPLQTFQNYALDNKPFTLAKMSGTILLDANEDNFDLMMTGGGTAAVTNTYTRRQVGGSDSGKIRVVGAVLVLYNVSATDIRAVLLNNFWITSYGDIKATGADGHLERDFEGICAPEDYVDDFLD
jgi:hypothetical protein